MLRLHRLLSKPLSSSSSNLRPPVAIFWDLSTSKPPTSLPAYDAAVRLHLTASSFGPLSLSLAYPTSHSFLPLHHHSQPQPQPQLQHRLHSSSSPHLCRICNRNFSDRPKLLNHFHQIHTSEHTKRLNRLNSLRSTRRANLAAKLSLKIKKYQKAAREILALNESVPFNLADELKRAGVLVRKVEDGAIGDDIVEEMDRRRFGCMVLVSGDEGFVGVLKEAERRGVMTVVVGEGEGVLRRCADVGFSWKDVVLGKARKAAGNAVGRWKDKGLLKVLEWRYKEEEERSECDDEDGFEAESEDDNGSLNLVGNEGNVPWWKLDQDQQRLEEWQVFDSRREAYPAHANSACDEEIWVMWLGLEERVSTFLHTSKWVEKDNQMVVDFLNGGDGQIIPPMFMNNTTLIIQNLCSARVTHALREENQLAYWLVRVVHFSFVFSFDFLVWTPMLDLKFYVRV